MTAISICLVRAGKLWNGGWISGPTRTDRAWKPGPIWEQSPTHISAVHICYRNEYHCCLGGPAPELKWWMTAARKISPPDVRRSQSDWTSVKINMKEKCCLATQTWLPGDLLVLITGWHVWSAKAIFPAKMEKSRNTRRCCFPGRHRGCSRGAVVSPRGGGVTETLISSCKTSQQDENGDR